MITVVEPLTMTSGGPAQTHKSPTTAAGKLPIKTVGTHGPVTGPPTCGFGVAKGHVCISVIRAADGITLFLNFQKKTAGSSLLLFLIDRSITSLSLTHIHFLLPMQDKRLMNVTCKNRNGHYLFVYYKILLSLLPQFAFCLQLL
jgi:hypothetical protein